MPQVVAWAAAAIVSAVGLTAGTAAATFATAVVSTAINVGISVGVNALLAPEVKAVGASPTTWQADPDAGIPFVSGRRGTAGLIVQREAFGKSNKYQSIVTVYSGAGPISGFSTIKLDDAVFTFDGAGDCLTPSIKSGRCWWSTRLGAQPDTALASPTLTGGVSMAHWGSAYKLSGKACSMLTLHQDGEGTHWPAGEPAPIIVILGNLVWDPRLDSTYPGGSGTCRLNDRSTWVYSTNPAIHALMWALGLRENGILVGGIGASVGKVDVAALVDLANTADLNGWTVSAVAYSTDDKYQIYQAYLQAAGAVPSRNAGKISCINLATPKTSVVTITVEDTAGPFELDAGSPRSGRVNTITPRCVQEDSSWQMTDLDPVSSTTYVTEDRGATRSRRVDYPFVSDKDQAAQLAAYGIADSREGLTGEILLKPHLRDLLPGDAFTVDEPGFVLNGQKFIVLRRSYDPATDLVKIGFRSETDGKHAWAMGQTGVAPASPSLTPDTMETVDPPDVADWTLTAGTGTTPGLTVTGAVPADEGIARLVVEYRVDGTTDWLPYIDAAAETVTELEIAGLTANVDYEVAISYRSRFGVTSSRLVLSPETTGYVEGADIGEDTIPTSAPAFGMLVGITEDSAVGTSVTIPSRGSPSGHVLIHTADFEVVRADSAFVVDVHFTYASVNANFSYIWFKIGQTAPVWAGSGSADMTNADRLWFLSGYNGPATWTLTITGLPVGTNTVEIHGGSTGSGSHINTADDPLLRVREDKKSD